MSFILCIKTLKKSLLITRNTLKARGVYCNCDTADSNFYKYFVNNKERLGIKFVIRSSIQEDNDFRSAECIELLKQADIVVTNRPFSCSANMLHSLLNIIKSF